MKLSDSEQEVKGIGEGFFTSKLKLCADEQTYFFSTSKLDHSTMNLPA